jgi:hypothetical protein
VNSHPIRSSVEKSSNGLSAVPAKRHSRGRAWPEKALNHEVPPDPAAHQWLRRDGCVGVKVRARLRAASVQVRKRVLSAEQIALGSLRSSSNAPAVPGPGFHVIASRRWRVQKAQGTTRVRARRRCATRGSTISRDGRFRTGPPVACAVYGATVRATSRCAGDCDAL